MRAWLDTQGTPIGPCDTPIAAHAQAVDVSLVRSDTHEFEQVPGLRLETWAVQE
jgi:tRNA(fMet)-specific endonuclease VapC